MVNWLRYTNQGATRNQRLKPKLEQALSYLDDMGLVAEVYSGGQDVSGPHRTGSHRHDLGGAGDVKFRRKDNGRLLSLKNKADIPILQEVVKRGRARGLTGFGMASDYMGSESMHLGYGAPGVWGAKGKGANAPGWLKTAFSGGGGLNGQPITPEMEMAYAEPTPSADPNDIPGLSEYTPPPKEPPVASLMKALMSGQRMSAEPAPDPMQTAAVQPARTRSIAQPAPAPAPVAPPPPAPEEPPEPPMIQKIRQEVEAEQMSMQQPDPARFGPAPTPPEATLPASFPPQGPTPEQFGPNLPPGPQMPLPERFGGGPPMDAGLPGKEARLPQGPLPERFGPTMDAGLPGKQPRLPKFGPNGGLIDLAQNMPIVPSEPDPARLAGQAGYVYSPFGADTTYPEDSGVTDPGGGGYRPEGTRLPGGEETPTSDAPPQGILDRLLGGEGRGKKAAKGVGGLLQALAPDPIQPVQWRNQSTNVPDLATVVSQFMQSRGRA